MSERTGNGRWYNAFSESWYFNVLKQLRGPGLVEEILVSSPGWELSMQWHHKDPEQKPRLKVDIFDDDLTFFGEASDLLQALQGAAAAGASPPPSTVRDLLDALGFEDRTERDKPDLPTTIRPRA